MPQDTLTAVRAAFAVKVIRLVSFMCGVFGGARKASKYAAMLALGAMDPVEANRQLAYNAMQEFVATRRAILDRQASSAAALPNGSAMHEQPELILPYLVQVCLPPSHSHVYIHYSHCNLGNRYRLAGQ